MRMIFWLNLVYALADIGEQTKGIILMTNIVVKSSANSLLMPK